MSPGYAKGGPTRDEIDAMQAPLVVQFGTDWCGFCQAAEPLIEKAFADFPEVTHLRIEDGKGRPAGRSFGVKLWPTLVFLHRGHEVARVVRPGGSAPVEQALAQLRAFAAAAP